MVVVDVVSILPTVVLVALALMPSMQALAVLGPARLTICRDCSKSFMSMETASTREDMIQRMGTSILTVGGVLVGGGQRPVGAYEKFEELRGELQEKERLTVITENLKVVEDAVKTLGSFDYYIAEHEYMNLRQALRDPPVGKVRFGCRNVIANFEGTQKAKVEEAYVAFTSSLEKMDRMASAVIKDKMSADDNLLYGQQNDSVRDGRRFLEVVRAALPPLAS
ncbi:unnamed protein product [Discosporangium mesarthrocarpum]